jgi:hypothetical protein
VAQYAAAGSPHRAQFAYDAAGRYVVAEDDEARALVGERAGAERTEQLPLGDDAIEVVTGRRPAPLAEEPTVDLTDTASAVRPADPFTAGPVRPDAADWISTQATERPEAPPHAADPTTPAYEAAEAAEAETAAPAEAPSLRTAPSPEEPAEALFEASELAPGSREQSGDQAGDQSGDQARDQTRDQTRDQAGEQAGAPPAEETPAAPRKRPKAKSKGRASVPSWDEIMFGSGRGEG